MKRERKRKGSERLIVWIAAAVMTAGLVVLNFLISEGIKNEAESLPEGVLLQLKEPLETAEIEAAKIQGYRIKNVGAGEHGREIYEVRGEKERAVLIGKVTDFTRDLFGRPIEGKSMNLSAHRSIALQMGRLAWLAAVIPLSMILLVLSIRKLGALQEKNWLQGLQGVAIIAVWMAAVYYLTGRLNIPREFLPREQILDIGFYIDTVKEFHAGDGWANQSAYQAIRLCYKDGALVYGMWIICAWLGTVLIRIIAGIENKGKGENISRG